MVDSSQQQMMVNDSAESSWQDQARMGNWKRASAIAQLLPADAHIVNALDKIVTLQADLRARRYLQASDSLDKAQSALQEFPTSLEGSRQLLDHWLNPIQLQQALKLLQQQSQQDHKDPASITSQLTEPLSHPFTKAEALNILGIWHAHRRESEAARTCLEQALEHDAGHYRARMNLGNLALESDDLEQAERLFRQVLQEAPDYDSAHHNLGVVLRRQGKLYESVKAIRKGQRLGVQRIKEDSKLEAKQQLATNPKLKLARWGMFALLGGMFFWLIFGMR